MAKVVFGNHSSVLVPRQNRDRIREFFCDVRGDKVKRADPERDFVCAGERFYIAFLHVDVPDVSEFLQSSRSVWLEIKSDDVKESGRRILQFGLVRKLDMPDPRLSFLAPGGQCLGLVGIEDDIINHEVGRKPSLKHLSETHIMEAGGIDLQVHVVAQ